MAEFPDRTPLYADELRASTVAANGVDNMPMASLREWYGAMNDCLFRHSNAAAIQLIGSELDWVDRRRPFFNVHPPVIRGLANTRLSVRPCDIPESVVHGLGSLCIKFPKKCADKRIAGVSHFFISINTRLFDFRTNQLEETLSVAFAYHTSDSMFAFPCRWDSTFEEADDDLDRDIETDAEARQRHFIARIGIGVMLLAADPEFIEPVLLRRDVGRTGDKADFARRAAKRGVIGWDIGKNLECSPHFRRPHFAIRWTGRGSKTPRLVPVRGSIIHKGKLAQVPTGFEDAK